VPSQPQTLRLSTVCKDNICNMAVSKDPIQPPPLLPRSDLLSLPSPPNTDDD